LKRIACAIFAIALLVGSGWAEDSSEDRWILVRTAHLEVYSDASGERARAAVQWLERLHAFFDESGLRLPSGRIVRVIGFGSAKAYADYRLTATSDAYYLGTDTRDYIVIPLAGGSAFTIAAHEYAHAQLRASGLKLPLWMIEGLADVFSTVRISKVDCYIGGPLPGRLQILKRTGWLTWDRVLAMKPANLESDRDTAALFYAQSWALTQMLALSSQYAPGFRALLFKLDAGVPAREALQQTYGKSLDNIAVDLREFVEKQRFEQVRLPSVLPEQASVETRILSNSESGMVLADLLMASGRLDRAEAMYRKIAQQQPRNAEVWAALGSIEWRKGDGALAQAAWKRAMEYGATDAKLCFRYAQLADDAGVAADEIRSALQRAVTLAPDFDDAHYKLALLESNAGRYEAAVHELKSMRDVSAGRGYAYWSTMSYALNELEKREEAKAAATNALEFARTSEEREHAMQLAYTAETDLSVQFTRDASGRVQMITTRVPHGADRNPFIEPGDRMQRSEGRLKLINCSGGRATGVVIESASGTVQLSIADPNHVQMRNAPPSFVCGEQTPRAVIVDYAAATSVGAQGLVRAIEFR
jgi:tetratricopeptide (TPR) repeat protein